MQGLADSIAPKVVGGVVGMLTFAVDENDNITGYSAIKLCNLWRAYLLQSKPAAFAGVMRQSRIEDSSFSISQADDAHEYSGYVEGLRIIGGLVDENIGGIIDGGIAKQSDDDADKSVNIADCTAASAQNNLSEGRVNNVVLPLLQAKIAAGADLYRHTFVLQT